MPRAPSEKAREAYKMFKQGSKLVEIAEKLKVPASTVRRWKFDHKWTPGAKKKQSERSDSKPNETERKASVRKHRSDGQKGNVNAAGSTNRGNPDPNTKRHEAYSRIYWDTLDDDEKELLNNMPKSEEDILEEQIALYSIRERRIMKAIDKYRKSGSEIYLDAQQMMETKRKFKDEEEKAEYERRQQVKIDAGDRLPGESYNLQSMTQNKDNIVIRLERELSVVQEKKSRAIQALAEIRLEKERMHGSAEANEALRVWAQQVMEERKHENDGE